MLFFPLGALILTIVDRVFIDPGQLTIVELLGTLTLTTGFTIGGLLIYMMRVLRWISSTAADHEQFTYTEGIPQAVEDVFRTRGIRPGTSRWG
jgi:hypothetical protein